MATGSTFTPQPLVGFKSAKAAQIAAYFAKRSGRSISKLKLIKLIYLAEREHLARHGRPMLYDELFSFKDGPVCSSALNGINGSLDKKTWGAFIALNHNAVSPKKEFERAALDEVSDAEMDILEDIWQKFGNMTPGQVRQYTHDHCPEYTLVPKGRVPISYKKLLSAVGREDAEDASDSIDAYRRVAGLLS